MDFTVSITYTVRLNPAELRVVSKALRGMLEKPEDKELALELQEKILIVKAQALQQAAQEAAKNAANVGREEKEHERS